MPDSQGKNRTDSNERKEPIKKHSRLWNQLVVFMSFSLLVGLVVLAYFFNSIFINIYPGEAGVYWKRFQGGTDMEYVYNEGLHIIPPWNKMYIYNVRIQHEGFEFEALSKDGLPINFEISVRYFPDKDNLPELHTIIGPNYVEKVVKPEVQANLRKVVANYLPDEIYTSEGYILQIIKQGAMGAFAERYIDLDNLLIRRMILPETIVAAIERKLTQEQRVQEYEYRLQVEAREARRKAIEAEGIKRFQDIVKTSNFFDKYLKFKGIDATVALAGSNNAKVVVIGGGEGKLPLIMNMDSGNSGGNQPVETATEDDLEKNRSSQIEIKVPDLAQQPDQDSGAEPQNSFLSNIQGYLENNGLWQEPPASEPVNNE